MAPRDCEGLYAIPGKNFVSHARPGPDIRPGDGGTCGSWIIGAGSHTILGGDLTGRLAWRPGTETGTKGLSRSETKTARHGRMVRPGRAMVRGELLPGPAGLLSIQLTA